MSDEFLQSQRDIKSTQEYDDGNDYYRRQQEYYKRQKGENTKSQKNQDANKIQELKNKYKYLD